MTDISRFFVKFCVVALAFAIFSGWSVNTCWAKTTRGALIVDHSDSMYGCTKFYKCETPDVGPEVRKSLFILLEMMDAYNTNSIDGSDRLDLKIFLFGGVPDVGDPEFEELSLTDDLDTNISIIENNLTSKKSYEAGTSFNLAFRETLRSIDNTQPRFESFDFTLFLTDGNDKEDVNLSESEKENIRKFGETYLYTFSDNTVGLTKWKEVFKNVSDYQCGEVIKVDKAWEILEQFSSVFQKLLIPQDSKQYLYTKDYGYNNFRNKKEFVLKFDKISANKARYYFIFQGESLPTVDSININFDGKTHTVKKENINISTGRNLIYIEVPDKTPAGSVSIAFKQPIKDKIEKAIVVGLEDVKLKIVDKFFFLNPEEKYYKNKTFFLNFCFSDQNGNILLEGDQLKEFLKHIHYSIRIRSYVNGPWTIRAGINGSPIRANQLLGGNFPPENITKKTEFSIFTAWTYHKSTVEELDSVSGGKFTILPDTATSLVLDFSAEDDKFIYGNKIIAKAQFIPSDNNQSIPSELKRMENVTIENKKNGETYTLNRKDGSLFYEGDIRRTLEPDTYEFKLIDPDPNNDPNDPNDPKVELAGTLLKIKPRKVSVKLNEQYLSYDGAGNKKQADISFWENVWNSLQGLFLEEKGSVNKNSEGINFPLKKTPYEKEVGLRYAGPDSYRIEFSARLADTSIVNGEKVGLTFQYTGNPSYTAENAYLPNTIIPFFNKAVEMKDTLKITTSPEPEKIKPLDVFKLELEKKNCDWDIGDEIYPAPELLYTFNITLPDNTTIPVASANIILKIKTKSFDFSLVKTGRYFKFFVSLALTVFIILLITGLLISYRVHIVQRRTRCREINARRPEDFCDNQSVNQKAFPSESFEYIQSLANKQPEGELTPAKLLRYHIKEEDQPILKKIWSQAKLSELELLLNRLKSPNSDSKWEFTINPGMDIKIFGNRALHTAT